MQPVTNKADCYRRMIAGEFGNTLPRWFDYGKWWNECPPLELWGVQHTRIPGSPGTRLDVRYDEVARVIREGGFGSDYCISPMVHQFGRVLWEGDVTELPGVGLVCSGSRNPEPGSWRRHMLAPTLWERSAARVLLRHVLNGNSYDDLAELLERYPGHVVELTALDACYGTHADRNAIIWEVRAY